MKRKIDIDKFKKLLDDETLVSSLLGSNSEHQLLTDLSEEDKESVDLLKLLVKTLEVDAKHLSPGDKSQIWNYIEQNSINKKRNSFYRKLTFRIASSVAIVAIIMTGIYFIAENRIDRKLALEQVSTDAVAAKQKSEVVLILDNGERITINDNDPNVSYTGTGEISVNSNQIKTDKNNNNKLNQLIVPYGKTSMLTLSDGSRIWVNSGSKLVYPRAFSDSIREIYVDGEIYIEVEKNKQPFIVKSEKMNIRVLGTKFNFSAYKDDGIQSVVLVEGLVNVQNTSSNVSRQITPNQKFSLNTENSTSKIESVDPAFYTSWTLGYLLLRKESLYNVLKKLERYYNVGFDYKDMQAISRTQVNGKLKLKDDLGDVLEALSITLPIKYTIKGDNKIEIYFESETNN